MTDDLGFPVDDFSTDLEVRRQRNRQRRRNWVDARRRRLEYTRPQPRGAWEIALKGVRWLSVAILIMILFLDIMMSMFGRPTSGESDLIAAIRRAGGFGLVAIGVCLVILLLVELASYKPRLYHKAEMDGAAIFDAFAGMNVSMRTFLDETYETPAATWSDAVKQQEALLLKSREYLMVDRIRYDIMWRVLSRVGLIVAMLSVVALGFGLAFPPELMSVFPLHRVALLTLVVAEPSATDMDW